MNPSEVTQYRFWLDRAARADKLFIDNLRCIQQVLEEYGIAYSLVGGLAIKGILNEEVKPYRENNTVIDFDAVAFGPDQTTIARALAQLKQTKSGKKDQVFPELGIEPVHFASQRVKTSPLMVLSSMRVSDDGRYFLTYRDIEVEVPAATMKLRKVELNGVTFDAFPDKTILYRYIVRGGMMKPKDDGKLVKLENFMVKNATQQLPDELYAPYLEFAELIRERYPLPVRVFDAFWQLDRLTGGVISGSSGAIYGLIKNLRS